ncbi:MAG: ABC transporter permease [bacterium]
MFLHQGQISFLWNDRAARMILAVTGTIMTIPSIAMFAFLIPLFGIGIAPALVGLTLYCLLPILRNTYTGLKNIDPAVLLAAQGMGMGEAKILWRIKLPLAFMVIMAGIRTAVVMGVGITAVAAYIGAGGLGQFIFRGISRANDKMVLTGAIFVAILAILLDYGLGWVERKLGT